MFDKTYYDDIWGTVHRHDYCMTLATWLLSNFGKIRILDVGTGCGFLVKTLREMGCDAYGLEISEYALENSCCPKYTVGGSIVSMPFMDNSFDLIHTQGVWGYFPEKDIPQAWNECKRVGRLQHHNIDCEDDIPEHQYLVSKSREWWDERLS